MEVRREPTQQAELFGDERPCALVGTPAWQDLPAATQTALTSLMAQLILEHAETRRAGPRAEAGHGPLTGSVLITWNARRCSTCGSPRPIRFCTTVRAARCDTPVAL